MKPTDSVCDNVFSWVLPLLAVLFFIAGLFNDSQRIECFGGALLIAVGMYSEISKKLHKYMSYAAELEKERDAYQLKYYTIRNEFTTQQRSHQ